MFINKILLASALLAVSVSATPVPQTTTSPISHNPAYSCGENHNARQKDWYIVPNLDLKGHADNKDHPVWDRKFENECECGAAISEVSNTTPLFVYNSETKGCYPKKAIEQTGPGGRGAISAIRGIDRIDYDIAKFNGLLGWLNDSCQPHHPDPINNGGDPHSVEACLAACENHADTCDFAQYVPGEVPACHQCRFDEDFSQKMKLGFRPHLVTW